MNILFVVFIILFLGIRLLLEFLIEGFFVVEYSLCKLLSSEVIEWIVDRDLFVNAHLLGYFHGVNVLVLWKDGVFICAYNLDHLLNVQTLDKILG